MAGTIDFGIIKPELGDAFGAGYRASQQERQQNALRQQQMQQQQQQLDISRENLEQLKQDRIAMTQLQDQLKAAGKDPDLDKVFDALIATGRPDYVMKGIEGKRKLKEQMRFEGTARQFYPELFGGGAPVEGAAPVAAPAAPAVPAPANALAATAAPAPAPANALVAPAAGKTPEQLRKEILFFSQSEDPRAKSMVDMLKGQLQEMTKTNVIGGRLVSGAGKEIYTAPPETSDIKEYEYAKKQGYAGTLRDWMIQQREAGAARMSVTNVQEKEEAKAYGARLVKNYDAVAESARLASKTIPAIDASLSILDKGFQTGFGTEAKAAGAKILGALGVADAEKYATNAQVFQAKAIEGVLQKQLEQKGPQTDSDAQRIEQIGSQLGKTTQANKFLLAVAKEQLKRDIEQRNFYDQWREANKGSFQGAEAAWAKGEGGRSLFDRPALKKYASDESTSAGAADKRKAGLDQIFGAPQKR